MFVAGETVYWVDLESMELQSGKLANLGTGLVLGKDGRWVYVLLNLRGHTELEAFEKAETYLRTQSDFFHKQAEDQEIKLEKLSRIRAVVAINKSYPVLFGRRVRLAVGEARVISDLYSNYLSPWMEHRSLRVEKDRHSWWISPSEILEVLDDGGSDQSVQETQSPPRGAILDRPNPYEPLGSRDLPGSSAG